MPITDMYTATREVQSAEPTGCAARQRLFARDVVTSNLFQNMVVLTIVSNSVMLALDDPAHSVDVNKGAVHIMEWIFSGIFVVEAALKIFADGVLYFKRPWNLLDFAVVCESVASLVFSGLVDISVLRLLRLLRPLRTVHRFPAVRVVVVAAGRSVNSVANILLILLVYLVLVSMMATLLWQGILQYHCVLESDPSEIIDDRIATCASNDYEHGSDLCTESDPFQTARSCPSTYECRDINENPFFGYLSFDNVLWSMLVMFQVTSIEGWNLVLWSVQYGFDESAFIFFVLIIMTGSFCILNLLIASIMTHFHYSLKAIEQPARSTSKRLIGGGQLSAKVVAAPTPIPSKTRKPHHHQHKGHTPHRSSRATGTTGSRHSPNRGSATCNNAHQRHSSAGAAAGFRSSAHPDVAEINFANPVLSGEASSYHAVQHHMKKQQEKHSKQAKHQAVNPRIAARRAAAEKRMEEGDIDCIVPREYESSSPALLGDDGPLHASAATSPGHGAPAHTHSKTMSPRARAKQFAMPRATYSLSLEQLHGNHHTNAYADEPDPPSPPTLRATRSADQGAGETNHHHNHHHHRPKRGSTGAMMVVYEDEHAALYNATQHHPQAPVRSPAAQHVAMRQPLEIELDESAVAALGADYSHHGHSAPERQTSGCTDSSNQSVLSDIGDCAACDLCPTIQRQYIACVINHPVAAAVHHAWHALQDDIRDPDGHFSHFIYAVITINVAVLAMDGHNISDTVKESIYVADIILDVIFLMEAVLKITALGWRNYFRSSANVFDFFLVVSSISHFLVIVSFSITFLRVLRLLRLLRILRMSRLARRYQSIAMVFRVIVDSMVATWPILVVLGLFLFVISVALMHLVGSGDQPDEKVRYDTFAWSFINTYLVIAGERWVEIMHLTMKSSTEAISLVFVFVVVLGQYYLLNLVLAIVLNHSEEHIEMQTKLTSITQCIEPLYLNRVRGAMERWRRAVRIPEPAKKALTKSSRSQRHSIVNTRAAANRHVSYDEEDILRQERLQQEQQLNEHTNHRVECGFQPDNLAIVDASNTAHRDSRGTLGNEDDDRGDHKHPEWSSAVADHNGHAVAYGDAAQQQQLSGRGVTRTNSKKQRKKHALRQLERMGQFSSELSVGDLVYHYMDMRASPAQQFASKMFTLSFMDPDRGEQAAKRRGVKRPGVIVAVDAEENTYVIRHLDGGGNEEVASVRRSELELRPYVPTCAERVEEVVSPRQCARVLSNKAFKYAVIIAIVLTTLNMLWDTWGPLEFGVDMAGIVIFSIEILLKFRAYGIWNKSRRAFCRRWANWLDLVVVLASICDVVFRNAGIRLGVKIVLPLKALRPVRLIARVSSLRDLFAALIESIGAVSTLATVMVFCWIGYAIIGQQLFKGLYYSCDGVDFPSGAPRDGKIDPVTGNYTVPSCEDAGGTWSVPFYNFDNIYKSFVCVFVMTSLDGWADIMYNAMDISELNHQPIPNNSMWAFVYFMTGVAFFGFYFQQLFVGIIFEVFLDLRQADEQLRKGRALRDRKEAAFVDRVTQIHPLRSLSPAESDGSWLTRLRFRVAEVVNHRRFDQVILFVVILNALVLLTTADTTPKALEVYQDDLNHLFAAVFCIEMLLKHFVLGLIGYWTDIRHAFDGVITIAGVLESALILSTLCSDEGSAFLRFVRSLRVFRLARILYLVPDMHSYVVAVIYPMKLLLRIFMVTGIFLFVYAALGTTFFSHIGAGQPFTIFANFNDLNHAMQLLTVVATGEEWADFMSHTVREARASETGWVNDLYEFGAVTYFLTFVLFMQFLMFNLFVMVIAEAFDILGHGERGEAEVRLLRLRHVWHEFDPRGTGAVKSEDFKILLTRVPPPVGVPSTATIPERRIKYFFYNPRDRPTVLFSKVALKVVSHLIDKKAADDLFEKDEQLSEQERAVKNLMKRSKQTQEQKQEQQQRRHGHSRQPRTLEQKESIVSSESQRSAASAFGLSSDTGDGVDDDDIHLGVPHALTDGAASYDAASPPDLHEHATPSRPLTAPHRDLADSKVPDHRLHHHHHPHNSHHSHHHHHHHGNDTGHPHHQAHHKQQPGAEVDHTTPARGGLKMSLVRALHKDNHRIDRDEHQRHDML